MMWFRARGLSLAWAGLLLVFAAARSGLADEVPPPHTVKLVVDYGDGVEKHFTALPWKEGNTILATMEAAEKHARGIKFAYRGKGTTAFLTQLDGLENEGRGRNWVFRVNGELGKASFAVLPVKAGDTILWTFGEYR